ncbi:MAG: transposase [Treponema sp.]|jgi:transposase|nr:transposase [Treponema sp.]
MLKYLDLHKARLKELREKIRSEAKRDESMKALQTVAGVGLVIAYAAHVGDGSRFKKGKQVSNYLEFVLRLDYSGTIQRQGRISKRGKGYVQGAVGAGGAVRMGERYGDGTGIKQYRRGWGRRR